MGDMHERLDPKALDRIAGPAWEGVREQFLEISSLLLDLSPTTWSELTTIYVKYMRRKGIGEPPFAVIWLKNSKQITIGLALPKEDTEFVQPAPKGMKYAGLTCYINIKPGERVPESLQVLARQAFENG
jgi:hypothetical protein